MVVMPPYIIILYFIIAVDYFAARGMESYRMHKKIILCASIVLNLGILLVFKYSLFAIKQWNVYHASSPLETGLLGKLILPIGLSFHTFQSMSYTIDVYRGKQVAERNLLVFANYVLFFPQLVAGPIERAQNMLHQFHTYVRVNVERMKHGALRVLYGLLLKCVIADRLSLAVEDAYQHKALASSANLWLACVFFTFQIYCDFNGYAQIAKGLARIMGYNFVDNFDRPYTALHIQDFWSKWHISLSSWFKDYVYIPLGGNQVPKVRLYFNVMVVFILSGVWHGANYTFLIWGLLHGGAVVLHRIILHKFSPILQWVAMWCVVLFGWVFFRATSITDATTICIKMLSFKEGIASVVNYKSIIASFVLIAILLIVEITKADSKFMQAKYFYLKCILGIIAFYILGIFSQNVFIYFQF
jgi:alginate O-acetyltransferase complex protein AlgI